MATEPIQRIQRLPGAKVGRPPLILQEGVRKTLLQALAVGNYATIACRLAKCSYAAFQDWIAWGRDARIHAAQVESEGKDPKEVLTDREAFFLQFLLDVEDAEARAEGMVVANLMRQTAASPQAALGFLSVRFPDRWRQKTAIEVSGPDGGPVSISPVLAGIPDEILQERIRMLEQEVEAVQIPAKTARKKVRRV